MDVLILYLSLCVLGYFLGAYLKKRNIVLKGASVLQTIALVALVFVMGARIGSEAEIVRSLDTIGLKGSPTNIFKSFTPPQKGVGVMLQGDGKETCEELAGILAKKHII